MWDSSEKKSKPRKHHKINIFLMYLTEKQQYALQQILYMVFNTVGQCYPYTLVWMEFLAEGKTEIVPLAKAIC